jgi:hypothetical protein
MAQGATAAPDLLDPKERRLRGIYPLLLLTTAYKQLWNTIAIIVAVMSALVVVLALVNLAGGMNGGPFDPMSSVMRAVQAMIAILSVAGLGFLLDWGTRRFGVGAGVTWLLLGLLALLTFFAGLIVVEHVGSVIEFIMITAPVQAYAILALVLFSFYLALHYIWVMFRGAFGLMLLPPADRAIMREMPPGASRMSRFLVGLWSLPPTFEFARRRRGRFAAIFAIAILASLLLSLASFLAVAWPNGWVRSMQNVDIACGYPSYVVSEKTACLARHANPLLFAFALGAAFVAVLLVLGGGARALLRRLVRSSLHEMQEKDARPPILFLRAFGDDQVPLPPPRLALLGRLLEAGRRRTNLDRLLLDEGTSYGPVVALGNPRDKRPPYGAARAYFDLQSWQHAVADLARNAAAVAVCIDDTEGIWWEIEHLTGGRHLDKTLFLLHPKHAPVEDNAKITARLARALRLDESAAAQLQPRPTKPGGRRMAGALAFYFDSRGDLRVIHSSTFSRFAYLLAIRQFLRGKLGFGGVPAVISAPAIAIAGGRGHEAKSAVGATARIAHAGDC